jgi:hypothetical protein
VTATNTADLADLRDGLKGSRESPSGNQYPRTEASEHADEKIKHESIFPDFLTSWIRIPSILSKGPRRMRGIDFEEELSSGDVVQVCRALRVLAGRHKGPLYPQRRVLSLLGPEHPDQVREKALVVLLKKGQHPLEDRRILDLLGQASSPLFTSLISRVSHLAFPSAAEDSLFWSWSKRPLIEDRKAILGAAAALRPRAARRLIQRLGVLQHANQVLVSAALSLLSHVDTPDTRDLFEKALTHRNPRFRSTALEFLAPRWNPEERQARLRPLTRDLNHRVRSTAAVLVYPDSAEDSLAVLKEMSRASNPLSRAAAAWALGELSNDAPGCRSLLQRLQGDPDPRVAQRAQLGLREAV